MRSVFLAISLPALCAAFRTPTPVTPRVRPIALAASADATCNDPNEASVINKFRASKLVVFSGASLFALANGGPPLTQGNVLTALGGCIACTLPGLADAHAAVSYGYGLAMCFHAACVARLSPASVASGGLLLAAYALYGIKVCAFQAARDLEPGYQKKVLSVNRNKRPGGPLSRLPLVVGVGTLLSTFLFPLFAVGCPAAPLGPRAASAITLGGATALGGLAFQTLADVQKFTFKKANGADVPMLATGVWRLCRHPNYLGEIIFHLGLLLAAAAASLAARSAALLWLTSLAPVTFISIMLGSTAGLERRQKEAYAKNEEYEAYLRETPRLIPGVALGGK